MKVSKDTNFELYWLIGSNGERFAMLLVDNTKKQFLPVETMFRMGWTLESITEDQKEIVDIVNNHSEPLGNVFEPNASNKPTLFLTHPFWVCSCKKVTVRHNSEGECKVCGETTGKRKGVRYLEIICNDLEKKLDMYELGQGMHTVH